MSTQLNDINALIGMKAGEAFERLFGVKPPKVSIEINDTVKEYNNARSWWERASGASIQCNNTIGKIGDINKAGIPCYICGIPMTKEFDGESPECEHILPIYQASLLLKLYHNESEDGKRAAKKIISDYENKMYNLEYKWSHACCNQIKSDLSFLSTIKKKGSEEYSMSDKNAKKILDKIWEGGHSKCSPKLMKEIRKQSKKDFTTSRIKAIKEETMSPIVKQLNNELNKKDSTKGMYYLSILANSISSINRKNFEKAVQGDAYREPPNYTEMRIKAYAEISAVVSNMFIKSFLKNNALTMNSIELLNIVTKSEIKFNRQMKSTSIASLVYESFIKDDIAENISNQLINKQTLFMDTFSFSYNNLKKTNINDYDATLQSILNASNALKYYILKFIITQKSKMEENAKKLRGRTADQLMNSINSFYDEIDTSAKILLLDMFPQVGNEIKSSYDNNMIPNNLNIVSKYVFDYVNYNLFDKNAANLEKFAKAYYNIDNLNQFHDVLLKMRSMYLQTSGDKYTQETTDTNILEGYILEDIAALKNQPILNSEDEKDVIKMTVQARENVKSKSKSKTPNQEGTKYNGMENLIMTLEQLQEIEQSQKKTDSEAADALLNLRQDVKRARVSSKTSKKNKSSEMDVVESHKTATPRYALRTNTRKRRRTSETPNSMRTQGGMKTRKAKK